MNELIFATTNKGKAATLQHYFAHAGLDVRVVAQALDVTEIQADTALEVAEAKAHEAFTQLAHPLVVDDSELRIEALNGFPGPYQKAMTEKLGPEGFVKLLAGYENRSAYFISNLVYVDEKGQQYTFSDDPYRGTIADAVDTTDRANAWGPLWKIFIPEGLDQTISQLTHEEKKPTTRRAQDKMRIRSLLIGMRFAMSKLWQSGRESALLDDIIAGRKTIEGRLNRGKFAEYQVGDIVSLRRDYRDEAGILHDGEADAARVEIVAIRPYASFLEMVTTEGFKRVIPSAASAQEAADRYNAYYSAEEQATAGVLAIEVKVA